MKTVELAWKGPFTIRECLLSPEYRREFGRSGVFVWEKPTDKGMVIAFAGGSPSNLWERQASLYLSQISASTSLPGEYRRCREDWTPDRREPCALRAILDVDAMQELVREKFGYVQSLRLHLAVYEGEDVFEVERSLIHQLWPRRTCLGKGSLTGVEPITLLNRDAKWKANPQGGD